MYTFLISGALPIIEYSALVVASELNEKINEPVKSILKVRYTLLEQCGKYNSYHYHHQQRI